MKIMSISLKNELYDKLKLIVPTRKISEFISEVLNRELEKKEIELIKAYKHSELDISRNDLLIEWDNIEDSNV